jgi:hypothetical protein
MYAARWDIAKGRTRQILKFCYVEVIDYRNNTVRLIENFGYGGLSESQSVFADYQYCNIGQAEWSKCPENFRYAN